ncbi:MAG: hypothetical protein AAB383_03050 [Patescibacteria group bacterium]
MEEAPVQEATKRNGPILRSVVKDPVGHARAILLITIAVKRIFEKGFAELNEEKKDGLPTIR